VERFNPAIRASTGRENGTDAIPSASAVHAGALFPRLLKQSSIQADRRWLLSPRNLTTLSLFTSPCATPRTSSTRASSSNVGAKSFNSRKVIAAFAPARLYPSMNG
jgi:hypothetical protein